MDKNNLNRLSTDEPTCWPSDRSKIPLVLDFYVSKGIPAAKQIAEQHLDRSSDQSPVMITLSLKVINKNKQLSLTIKSIDWKLFRELLEERTITVVPPQDAFNIDEPVESLTYTIQKAAWDSAQIQIASASILPNCLNTTKENIYRK